MYDTFFLILFCFFLEHDFNKGLNSQHGEYCSEIIVAVSSMVVCD